MGPFIWIISNGDRSKIVGGTGGVRKHILHREGTGRGCCLSGLKESMVVDIRVDIGGRLGDLLMTIRIRIERLPNVPSFACLDVVSDTTSSHNVLPSAGT